MGQGFKGKWGEASTRFDCKLRVGATHNAQIANGKRRPAKSLFKKRPKIAGIFNQAGMA